MLVSAMQPLSLSAARCSSVRLSVRCAARSAATSREVSATSLVMLCSRREWLFMHRPMIRWCLEMETMRVPASKSTCVVA